MNALILLASQDTEGQVARIARTFGVDWVHLGAQIISFCLVCLLLYLFAYKQILAMLEERRRQIAQGLANAEKISFGGATPSSAHSARAARAVAGTGIASLTQ